MSDLIILDKPIRQQNGLYCLNDLHRASGGASKHRPNNWLQNQQTIEFIDYLEAAGIPAGLKNQQVIHRVNGVGTYGNRKVALAYATWISPEFFSLVLDVFDGVVSGSLKVAAPYELPPPRSALLAALKNAPLRPPRSLAEADIIAAETEKMEYRLRHYHKWLAYWRDVWLDENGYRLPR